MIYPSLTSLIGRTPLVALPNLSAALGLSAPLIAKLERTNPGGSAKDRVALEMILDAEARGLLTPGATIIEPTSGNTGIGLAWVGTARGYRVILTMPETMSAERQSLVRAYGAQVVLTPGADGMAGSIARAEALRDATPGAVILGQFDNPANPLAHYKTTGPELWEATEGKLDLFIATVGTGGTLSGTGRYLKEQNPGVQIIAVEPAASPLLSGGQAGPHAIQGIGANFIPATLDRTVYDQVLTVSDEEALSLTALAARTEGLLVGISSGAALSAAARVMAKEENSGKTAVVLLPDTGERYLSTGIYG